MIKRDRIKEIPPRKRKYVTMCAACDCHMCIYNAEMGNITNDIDEKDYCYRCEDCVEYGGKIRGTAECEKYSASQDVLDRISKRKREHFRVVRR